MKAAVLLALAASVAAQGPGNGLAKTTYACYDVQPGLEFILKYFPTTPEPDSCSCNYCATSSGTGYKEQGRAHLVDTLVDDGYFTEGATCELYSKVGGSSTASSVAAITVPTDITTGDDCSYEVGSSFDAADVEVMWSTYATTGDTCCKACATTAGCVASNYNYSTTPSSKRRRTEGSYGFGLHLVDVFYTSTTGGTSVYELEQHFEANIGDMSEFVPFMDYSVALFSANLPAYADIFAADDVPTLAASWTADTGATWYSLFVRVPESQMIIELIGTESPLTATRNTSNAVRALTPLEARVSPRNVAKFAEYEADDLNLVYAISISRATSNMTAIEHFYDVVVNATVVHTVTDEGKGMTRKCYKWGWAEADVCFTNRPDVSSSYTVKQFEEMLWSVHATNLQAAGDTDKFTDNHYAVDLHTLTEADLATYFTAHDPYPVTNATREAYTCDQSGFLIDPTGFSIQLDLGGSSLLPGCSRSIEGAGELAFA